MARERSRGRVQSLEAAGEADRAEEAGDDVEAPAEGEVTHVGLPQREAGEAQPGDREEPLVEVDAFAVEVGAQVLQVLAGAARDVEERSRLRPSLPDDP